MPAQAPVVRETPVGSAAFAATARLRPVHAALILAVFHVIAALLAFDPTPHSGGDNAAYLALARSILERGAYLDYWDPLTPPHTQYPPVFPLLLAALDVVGVHDWVGLKMVIVLLSGVAVAFTYLWARRWHSASVALGVGLLVAFGPGVLNLAHWVLSDVPFWALVMVALWAFAAVDGTAIKRARLLDLVGEAAARPRRDEVDGPQAAARRANAREVAAAVAADADRLSAPLWIGVVATALAYLTRSAGLPLVLAPLAWLAWRRRWKSLALLLGVVGVPALLWWLRSRGHGGVDYLEQFLAVDPYQPALGGIGPAEMLGRMGENAVKYVGVHLPVLLFGRTGPLLTVLSLLVVAAGIGGWAIRLRRPGIAELFLPLYVGLLLVWPAVWSGERFLLPVLPVLLGAAAHGLLAGIRAVRAHRVGLLAPAAVAGLLLVAAPGLRAAVRQGFDCTTRHASGERWPCLAPTVRSFFEVAEWSRDALPDDAAVISRKPTLFYRFADRRSRIFERVPGAEPFFRTVAETGSRYLVLDRIGGLTLYYVGPILSAHPERFCVLHVSADQSTVLFGILPEGAAPAPPPRAGAPSFRACGPDFVRPGTVTP